MARKRQSTIDLTAAELFRMRLLEGSFAENTIAGYESDWHHFTTWCTHSGRLPEPASVETLSLYISTMLGSGLRVTTAERRLSAVLHYHREKSLPLPTTKELRRLLTNGRRLQRGNSNAKMALTGDHIRQVVARFDADNAFDIRNKALLLVGFATAMRRSELVNIDMEHLTFEERGAAVFLPFSKKDQLGKGRYLACFFGDDPQTCPVRALRKWLELRGDSPGRVFCQVQNGKLYHHKRITGQVVNRIVKQACEFLGLDPLRYGAHSLRAGFVTTAGKKGASPFVIMATTGHKNVQTVQRYFRMDEAFSVNPLKGVL